MTRREKMELMELVEVYTRDIDNEGALLRAMDILKVLAAEAATGDGRAR
jgi:hypothetical protein